jgi:hypothetical protein
VKTIERVASEEIECISRKLNEARIILENKKYRIRKYEK